MVRAWIKIGVALMFWLGTLGGMAHAAPPERPPVLAVMPFNYVSGPSIYTWLRGAVPAAVGDKYRHLPDARLADPASVGQALSSLDAQGPIVMDRRAAQHVARAVGADMALWGDVAKVGADVVINLYLSPVASDVDSVRLTMRGDAEALVPLSGEVALALAEQLGVVVDDGLHAALARPAARDRYTLVLWGRALDSLDGLSGPADAAEARATLLRTLRIDPRLASGWYSLARAELKLGNDEAAISCLYEALRHRPDDSHAHRWLARLARDDGRHRDAVRHLAELTALESEDAAAHLDLALSLAALGRQDAALVEAELAVGAPRTHDAVLTEALRLLGRYRGIAGDHGAMVEAFGALLERRPGDREALMALAAAAMALGDMGAVTAYAHRLRQGDLADPLAAHLIGEAALQNGDARAAVSAFNSEIATQGAPPAAFAYLARAFDLAGYHGAALQALEQAATRDSTDGARWHALGQGYAAVGDDDAAATAFRRAVAQAPQWAEGWMSLGAAELRRGRFDAAEEALLTSLQLDDTLGPAHYHLSLVDVERGELAEAAERLRLAVALSPELTAALYNLGAVLDRLGEGPAAASTLEAYLRAQPDDPQADDIRERIEALRG